MRYQSGGAKALPLTNAAALAALGGLSVVIGTAPAAAAGTPAGTNISNSATATYEMPSGAEASVESNTVTLLVDELLDVAVSWSDPGDVVGSAGTTNQVLRFTVTNAGNGAEAFSLAASDGAGGDDFDPSVTSIVLDSNANGAYDAGVDTAYVAGSNDPELDPDETVTVFVLSTLPASAADTQRGRVDFTAAARTGAGTPGTSFAGAGQGGGNAVVGATGGKGEDDGYYKVSKASLSFVKSAAVADPFGGTTQGPGSVVTYTLTATVNGSGALANVRVTDPIPAGTTYQPGSITLDSGALSDAADGDSGRFTGSGIEVGLGSLAAGASKTISFKVKID
jgi:uncharacterized repeat protein (TIGR01451 family)